MSNFRNMLILTVTGAAYATSYSVINVNCANQNREKVPRPVLCPVCLSDYFELSTNSNHEQQFINNYRLNHAQFAFLMQKINNIPLPSYKWPVWLQVMIFLDFTAGIGLQKTISRLYKIPKSSVNDIIHRVIDWIFCLKELFIWLPDERECKLIASGFANKCSIPDNNVFRNVTGAIDGTLIQIKVPSARAEQYFDRHYHTSITMTAVCDDQMVIRMIDVGQSGSHHDSYIFKNTSMYMNKLFPPTNYIILGDSAYPNSFKNVATITPYKLHNQADDLPYDQLKFNAVHSSLRMTIENSFGDLKQKWRILNNKIDIKLESAAKLVATTVILNNLTLIDLKDLKNHADKQNPEIRSNERERLLDLAQFADADQYRDYLKNLISRASFN